MPAINPRSVAGGIAGLGLFVANLVKDDANAYDTGYHNTCVIHTSTTNGSSCHAHIKCGAEHGATSDHETPLMLGPGPGTSADTWPACHIDGQQFMYDWRVGNFSVTYTQAGGNNSDWDGLHHPVLRFESIDNWAPIDAHADAIKPRDTGHICGYMQVTGSQVIEYYCGVPQVRQTHFGLVKRMDLGPIPLIPLRPPGFPGPDPASIAPISSGFFPSSTPPATSAPSPISAPSPTDMTAPPAPPATPAPSAPPGFPAPHLPPAGPAPLAPPGFPPPHIPPASPAVPAPHIPPASPAPPASSASPVYPPAPIGPPGFPIGPGPVVVPIPPGTPGPRVPPARPAHFFPPGPVAPPVLPVKRLK